MAPPRDLDPTGLYHVMSRGNYRQTMFFDDAHFGRYTYLLNRVARRRKWVVLDWCLIPNHYHLLIQLTDGGLSEGMRELNGCYSRWSNIQTRRTGTGHLVRNRFTLVPVVREAHLVSLMSYIPLNPVRADLVTWPDEWHWSGFPAALGAVYPLPFHRPGDLLEHLSPNPAVARRLYRSLVGSALEQHWDETRARLELEQAAAGGIVIQSAV